LLHGFVGTVISKYIVQKLITFQWNCHWMQRYVSVFLWWCKHRQVTVWEARLQEVTNNICRIN